jgi:chromate transporter
MPAESPSHRPSLIELFLAFATVSLSGFGGALPWARRVLVERRGWMTAQEFNEGFSLSQFLPGPNLVNFSVVFGSRFGGVAGALVAFLGLIGPPVVIISVIAALYAVYGDIPALGRMLTGVAAAAAGLLIATVAKMAAPLFRGGRIVAPAVAVIAFVAIGPLHLPLQWVLLVMVPLSIAHAWWRA